jgi:hypothetical protein
MSGIHRENTVAFENLPNFSQTFLRYLGLYGHELEGVFFRRTAYYKLVYKPDRRDDPAITPCGGNFEIRDAAGSLKLTVRVTMPGLRTGLNDKYNIVMVGWPLPKGSELVDFGEVFVYAMSKNHPDYQLINHQWICFNNTLKLVLRQKFFGTDEEKNRNPIMKHMQSLVASFMLACVKDHPVADQQIRLGLHYPPRAGVVAPPVAMARIAPVAVARIAPVVGEGGVAIPVPKSRSAAHGLPNQVFTECNTVPECIEMLKKTWREIKKKESAHVHVKTLEQYVLEFLFRTEALWTEEIRLSLASPAEYRSLPVFDDIEHFHASLAKSKTLGQAMDVIWPPFRRFVILQVTLRGSVAQLAKIVMQEQAEVDGKQEEKQMVVRMAVLNENLVDGVHAFVNNLAAGVNTVDVGSTIALNAGCLVDQSLLTYKAASLHAPPNTVMVVKVSPQYSHQCIKERWLVENPEIATLDYNEETMRFKLAMEKRFKFTVRIKEATLVEIIVSPDEHRIMPMELTHAVTTLFQTIYPQVAHDHFKIAECTCLRWEGVPSFMHTLEPNIEPFLYIDSVDAFISAVFQATMCFVPSSCGAGV